MAPKAADSKPLPLSDTLHDLAVLRASDIDLAAFLPSSSGDEMDKKGAVISTTPSNIAAGDTDRDQLVAKSFEYVREARAAIRLIHRGDVDNQGARVDTVRGGLEDILSGLAVHGGENPETA